MTDKGFYEIEATIEDVMDNGSLYEAFYLKELQQRKLFLNGDVDQFSVEDIKKHILQMNREDIGVPVEDRKPIQLYVNSAGGDVDAGFGLIDTILMSKTPVHTINLGFQYSMGFLIGLAGHKRFASPNARFLMHDGSNFIYNSGAKAQDQMEFNRRVEGRIKQYIMARSNITSEAYDNKLRIEWYMFADEAKENGFTDYIIGVDCDVDSVN